MRDPLHSARATGLQVLRGSMGRPPGRYFRKMRNLLSVKFQTMVLAVASPREGASARFNAFKESCMTAALIASPARLARTKGGKVNAGVDWERKVHGRVQ